VVAVIVENVMKEAMQTDEDILAEAEKEFRATLISICDIYKEMDGDFNGVLTKTEFTGGLLNNTEVRTHLKKLNINLEDAEDLFDLMDYNGNGEISLEEFTNGCMKARGSAKAKDLLSLTCKMGKFSERLDSATKRLHEEVGSNSHRLDSFQAMLERILVTSRSERETNSAPVGAPQMHQPNALGAAGCGHEQVMAALKRTEGQFTAVRAMLETSQGPHPWELIEALLGVESRLMQITKSFPATSNV